MTATPAEASRAPLTIPTAATIGALGVVYGDIGTSPLYALRKPPKPRPATVAGQQSTRMLSSAWCR